MSRTPQNNIQHLHVRATPLVWLTSHSLSGQTYWRFPQWWIHSSMVRCPQSRGFCYQGFFRAFLEYIVNSFSLLVFLNCWYWLWCFFLFFLFFCILFQIISLKRLAMIWSPYPYYYVLLFSFFLVLLCKIVDALKNNLRRSLSKESLRTKVGLLAFNSVEWKRCPR